MPIAARISDSSAGLLPINSRASPDRYEIDHSIFCRHLLWVLDVPKTSDH